MLLPVARAVSQPRLAPGVGGSEPSVSGSGLRYLVDITYIIERTVVVGQFGVEPLR